MSRGNLLCSCLIITKSLCQQRFHWYFGSNRCWHPFPSYFLFLKAKGVAARFHKMFVPGRLLAEHCILIFSYCINVFLFGACWPSLQKNRQPRLWLFCKKQKRKLIPSLGGIYSIAALLEEQNEQIDSVWLERWPKTFPKAPGITFIHN